MDIAVRDNFTIFALCCTKFAYKSGYKTYKYQLIQEQNTNISYFNKQNTNSSYFNKQNCRISTEKKPYRVTVWLGFCHGDINVPYAITSKGEHTQQFFSRGWHGRYIISGPRKWAVWKLRNFQEGATNWSSKHFSLILCHVDIAFLLWENHK